MKWLHGTLLTLLLTTCGSLSFAAHAAYPDKPIRLIVPFPPGGGTDVLAREVATAMAKKTGWNFVIQNLGGAGGNIGVEQAVKAAPDGYTLVFGQTSNLTINPTLYTHLPYDPERDLTPIGLVAQAPLVLAVSAKSPYHTLADVLAAARAKPGSVTIAFSGNGTVADLTTILLQQATGVRITPVPYKGAEQGLVDLIGGRVDMYLSSVPTLIGQIQAGALRAIVVTSTTRSGDLPNTPTFAESGFKDFDAVTWFGFAGPAGLPKHVVDTLHAALADALRSPEIQKQYEAQGADVRSSSPQAFGTLIHDDRIRWGRIVKASGAHVD